MATLFWVIWQERDVFIFEWKGMDNIEELWIIFLNEEVHLLASLWASVSMEFQDSSSLFIHLNWEGVLR